MKLWIFYTFFAAALGLGFIRGPNDDPEMPENQSINGTITKQTSLKFALPGVGRDWSHWVFGFQLETDSLPIGSVMGEGIAECSDNPGKKTTVRLLNKIPSTRYNQIKEICDGQTLLTVKSTVEIDSKYWMICIDNDSSMYGVLSDVEVMTAMPGELAYEFVNFRGHVGVDEDAAGRVDFVNITIHYDTFSATKIKAFVAESMRPVPKDKFEFIDNGNGILLAQMQRDHKWFCTECYMNFTVLTVSPSKTPCYFSVNFHVDRGVVGLKHNMTVEGVVHDDNHGDHYIIDMRKFHYDTDLVIELQKLDEPAHRLNADISLTSFDDGEWDTVKTLRINPNDMAKKTWGISRTDSFYKFAIAYYVRVITQASAPDSSYRLYFKYKPVPFKWVFLGKTEAATTKTTDYEIKYYKTYVPKEDFVDVKSVTISMSDIKYTFNESPPFCFGYDIFIGRADKDLINNPMDPKSYTYHEYVSYQDSWTGTISEGDIGWCEDCEVGVSIRTEKTTSWSVTSVLGYVPYIIQPNVHKKGVMRHYTGGVQTYIYHYVKSEVSTFLHVTLQDATKDPDIYLYVSTTPNPSVDNYHWMETTIGDGSADIEFKKTDPHWCNNCKLYVGIYFVAKVEQEDTNIDLYFDCNAAQCKVCNLDGLDPSTDCKECLPGRYGPQCTMCKHCGHGKCAEGIKGTGECVCDRGWGPRSECNTCVEGFFGINCSECPNCNNGKCDDGPKGSGYCQCNENFDPSSNCATCYYGYYGKKCDQECPGGVKNVCTQNGVCRDGVAGNGRCTCNEGWVGKKCDTEFDKDRCVPHCVVGQGACDEVEAKCECWDGWSGKDCSTAPKKPVPVIPIIIAVVVIIIVILVIVIVATRSNVVAKKFGKDKTTKFDEVLLTNVAPE